MGGGPVQGSGPSPGQPWGTLVPLSLNIQAMKWGHNSIGLGEAYSFAHGQHDRGLGMGWGTQPGQRCCWQELPLPLTMLAIFVQVLSI